MKHKYLTNVTTLDYCADLCVGCGRCTEVCPHGVFGIAGSKADGKTGGKAQIIDRDSCMECGACAMNCPVGAIIVCAGTGCAAAIIMSWFTGREPECGCSADDDGDSKCC